MKYKIISGDTDALNFCKPDQSPFTPGEQQELIKHLNDMFPGFTWELDGFFSRQINLAAKNYIMMDEQGKITYKGSSLKSATLEPALKEFLKEIINSLLYDKNDFTEIYNKYVLMIHNITDIKPWCSKKTISDKTLTNDRENEAKIKRAIEGTEYVEGDRVYLFYTEDKELCLAEKFNGNYDKKTLLKKLFKTSGRFWDETTVLSKDLFLDYSLKRKNVKELEKLLNENS